MITPLAIAQLYNNATIRARKEVENVCPKE